MKKILGVGIMLLLTLVAISYATATSNVGVDKKESPLYRIRTKIAISEEIGKISDNIKTKFLGDRIFQIPKILYKLVEIRNDEVSYMQPMHSICCTGKLPTCYGKGTCDDGFLCEPLSVTQTKSILTCSGVSQC